MTRPWMLAHVVAAGLCLTRAVAEADVFWCGLALWFVAGLLERAR